MEANFFRCLAGQLGPALAGTRVQKIYNPAPSVWTFALGPGGGFRFLHLRHGKRDGLLFPSDAAPENPFSPSAACMWFRKRLKNRRLGDPLVCWTSRRLAWALGPGPGRFLVLDTVDGPSLEDELPPEFGKEPSWPDLDRVLADPGIWRDHPQITPPLRRILAALPPDEAEALYCSVRNGECGLFFLMYEKDGGCAARAWPVPGREGEGFATALEAAGAMGRKTLFPYLDALAAAGDKARISAEHRRLRRALARAEADVQRLEAMAALTLDGQALKAVLSVHGGGARLDRVEVPAPDGGTRMLELDPRSSLVENMEKMFKRAAKGRRGLLFVAGRLKELRAALAALEGGGPAPAARPGPGRSRAPGTGNPVLPPPLPGKLKGLAVAVFRTTDGLAVYRGKSAKANHALLSRGASPHDLWFHASGGPGAHCILKLDYPGQEPPETSLAQAAALAGLKSHYAGSDRAEVMCAVVRDVRKVKGAAPGSVRVDQVWRTLVVDLDPGLERRLAVSGGNGPGAKNGL